MAGSDGNSSDASMRQESAHTRGKRPQGRSRSRDVLRSLEVKSVKCELAVADHAEQLDRLNQFVEEVDGKLDGLGDSILESVNTTLTSSSQTTTNFIKAFEAKMFEALAKHQAQVDEVKSGLEEMRGGFEDMKADWAIYKKAIAAGPVTSPSPMSAPRIETPRPKEYSGKRDAKELDNFL